jgi:hypothetical protein
MDVEIVSSVKYGKYKEFLDHAKVFKMLIQKSELRVRKHINLPEQFKIILRPIRGVFGTAATYKVNSKPYYTVEIDVRQTIDEFCDTLLHELVHIEQYFEGRLKLKSELFYSIYEGRKIRLVSSKSDEYHDLPWEKEATKRAAKLKHIINL